jgi:thiol-disulfide isomerase/thioredoxin
MGESFGEVFIFCKLGAINAIGVYIHFCGSFNKTNLMRIIIPFLFIVCLISCESRNTFLTNIDSKNSQIDSVYIVESITDKIISRLPVKEKSADRTRETIEYPTIGSIQTKDGKQSYLTILSSNKELNIIIESDSTILTSNLGDSILNYLMKSNNEFIGQNANFIFNSNDTDSIVKLFQDFEASRKLEIEKRSSKLSLEEKELLLYQNSARIHSFMFFFGRIAKNFPANHEYFAFIKNIDNNTLWAKTLPQNLLWKHEINYLLAHNSIESNESFMDYVTSQTNNNDLLDFLKAIYITEIIAKPSYWLKHEKHLTTSTLKEIVAREESNKYYDLIFKPSHSFFSSQKGVEAYDFEAERIDGSKVKLSDFKGKIVFIDSWASWCGPCLAHRPQVLELAKKYGDNKNVEILMISMDSDRDDWLRYLTKKDQLDIEGDLIIENGMKTEYGEHFNVNQIPKYMLIDKDGIIINSNISEPSVAVEEMIEYELRKM